MSVLSAPILLTIVTFLNSTPVMAETLSDALRSVHGGNARLEAERAKQRGESEKVNQAKAGFLPNVYLQGENNALFDRNLRSGSTSKTNPHSYGIGFSQPIFSGFRTMGEYQRAQDEVLASHANLFNAQQTTLLYGAQAYMRVLRDRKVLTLRHENLTNLRQQQMQANARFKAGDMTLTGVDQTKARVAEAEADLAQTMADLSDSESYYRYMIGREPAGLRMPALSRVSLPCSIQDAVLVAESDNPQLQSAYHLERAADGSIKSAKAAFYPSFSFEGSLRRGFDDSKQAGAQVDDATFGVKMSMPLYSGGIDKSRVRAAEEAKLQRTFELNDTRNNTRRIVTSSYDALRSARLRKQASNKRVEATNAALYGLNIEFKAGQIPLINLLDGRREATNARVTQAVTDFDESINIFNLLAAIGHLDMAMVDALTQGRAVNTSAMCFKNAPAGAIARALPVSELAKLAPTQEKKPAKKEAATLENKEAIEPEVLAVVDEQVAPIAPIAKISSKPIKEVAVKEVAVKEVAVKEVAVQKAPQKPMAPLVLSEEVETIKIAPVKAVPLKAAVSKVQAPEVVALESEVTAPAKVAPLKNEASPSSQMSIVKQLLNREEIVIAAPEKAANSNLDKPKFAPGALAYFQGKTSNSIKSTTDTMPLELKDTPSEAADIKKAEVVVDKKKINTSNLKNIKANAPLVLSED
jgi:outer membrane protein